MTTTPAVSAMQATDAGGVTGVAVPAHAEVTVQDAPKTPDQPPDHWAWRYAMSMVMELHDGAWQLSLGRTMLLTLFVHALVVWSGERDIHSHEMTAMGLLLGYVFGSKIAAVVEQWKS